ncbi:MAG: hypothetical protein WCX30_01980 [Candidatus Paceibacterota bacterium]|nr:hypothetical protein [bacterium]
MEVKRSIDPSLWGFNGRIKETDSKFRCPHCGRLLEFQAGTGDEVMICPVCGYKKNI